MRAGAINGYRCQTCGRTTWTIDADEGVTPMFLKCLSGFCSGTGQSLGYHAPDGVVPTFRWRKASNGEMKRWRRDDPSMYEHCQMGGLVLEAIA